MNKAFIPNAMTLGNLVCGVLSIQFTINNDFTTAALFILIAGLLDRYDGTVARYLNINSDLGKELDSLCDLVSFGVAPSILIFSMYNLDSFGAIGYIPLIIFPVAGAFRLARYNCSEFNNVFTGIPITISGSILAILAIFNSMRSLPTVAIIVIMILFSYLMVSKFKIKKR